MNAKKIAMWSGPRNLSTALMRSFSSRDDCSVIDEPFYAAYLFYGGFIHPMREKILEHYDTDPIKVAEGCLKRKSDKPIEYQKHMTHHMLEGFDRNFIYQLINAFLIRVPAKVIRSFGKKIGEFNILQLGIVQQVEIFNLITQKTGAVPPIIDADDLCNNPREGLTALCAALNIKFCETMLTWDSGPQLGDGIWGEYWYSSVNESRRFKPSKIDRVELNSVEKKMEEKIHPYFEQLNQYKILF